MAKITAVMPTYNEKENLETAVHALFALNIPDFHILVVDDNSPDGTGDIAERLALEFPGRLSVLHRAQKAGLGPAYLAGFRHALAQGAEYVLQMDSDGSHQPKYVPQMVAEMDKGADMVLASRHMPGGSVDERWSPFRKFLTWFANRVYVPLILWLPVHDATGGFRLWHRRTLIGMDLERVRSSGYVFQVEITYLCHKMGYKIVEIPIHFPDRTLGKSKMSTRIQVEAALRVWQILARHVRLSPTMRRTTPYA